MAKNTVTKLCKLCTWRRWRSSTVGYKPLLQRLLSAFCANDMQDAKQQAHQGQGQDTVEFSHSRVIAGKTCSPWIQRFITDTEMCFWEEWCNLSCVLVLLSVKDQLYLYWPDFIIYCSFTGKTDNSYIPSPLVAGNRKRVVPCAAGLSVTMMWTPCNFLCISNRVISWNTGHIRKMPWKAMFAKSGWNILSLNPEVYSANRNQTCRRHSIIDPRMPEPMFRLAALS